MDAFETAKALFLEGLALIRDRNYQAAESALRASLDGVPDRISTMTNLSFVLIRLQKYADAERLIDIILSRDPTAAEAWLNRGLIARDCKRDLIKALEYFETAVKIRPDYAEAHLNLASVLTDLKRYDAALDSYDRAVDSNPGLADIYYNRAATLRDMREYRAAIENYDKVFEIEPTYEFLFGSRLHTKMQICDWTDFDAQLSLMALGIERGEKHANPFQMLGLTVDAALQRKAASIWANEKHIESVERVAISPRSRGDRIRIGYFSADFRDHPVAYLIAEMLELHDKSKFEILGLPYGPKSSGAMRNRLFAAFDKIIGIELLSDADAARLAREHDLDIAVDLTGYTQYGRMGIFAHRAAPVQVSYLGYAGTSATSYLDYIIADETIIPEASRRHYSEKIAYLPDCYQPNDRKRAISDRTYSREELGLPETGFVFCCFNNSYKITRAVFEIWMRILAQVSGSVIWFREDNKWVVDNLRNEARRHSIDPDRLVFAKRVPSLDDHLARYRTADLFLDTIPFNAHTTASDALWAGVPLVTCCGEALASRVAASLLKAIGLEDLVAQDLAAYQTLAVSLARDPERLRGIRLKLAQSRDSAPLFDSPTFTKYIEDAYIQMHQRNHAGLLPDHIWAGKHQSRVQPANMPK